MKKKILPYFAVHKYTFTKLEYIARIKIIELNIQGAYIYINPWMKYARCASKYHNWFIREK